MSEPYDESTSGPGPAFQPPVYGNQPSGYPEQPPVYGNQPPVYGSQPSGYPEQPPVYGSQPPVYGNQPGGYGDQPPAYGGWAPPTAPSAWGDGGVGSPYGTGYTFTAPAPAAPPPPRRRRRAGLFVALGVFAAFAVGVAGAEVGRYVTSAGSVPTVQPTSQPSTGTTTVPSTSPSTGSTSSGTSGSTGDTSSIAAIIDPALVDIVSTFSYQQAEGAGTGIVLTATGEILTNNHVISGATSISVTDVGNGQTYTASVVGYDASHDVAVLQLQGASGLQTASLSTAAATVGEAVVGAGNAGGTGGTPTAAAGSVVAVSQSISASNELTGTSEQLSDLIEVNANIQSGDSGGALVDSTGAVIGINTAGSSNYSLSSDTGRGYAIPISDAMAIATAVEAGQSSSTTHVGPSAFMGILMGSTGNGRVSRSATSGALVGGVVAGDPAAKAGIVAGDTITSLGGKTVDSATTLGQLMIGYHPDDTVTIGWVDTSGTAHSAKVTLVSGPAA
jgi:S1-C subfamily serine protease